MMAERKPRWDIDPRPMIVAMRNEPYIPWKMPANVNLRLSPLISRGAIRESSQYNMPKANIRSIHATKNLVKDVLLMKSNRPFGFIFIQYRKTIFKYCLLGFCQLPQHFKISPDR